MKNPNGFIEVNILTRRGPKGSPGKDGKDGLDGSNGSDGDIRLKALSKAPSNIADGILVLADGTSWNPLGRTSNRPYLVLRSGNAWRALNE